MISIKSDNIPYEHIESIAKSFAAEAGMTYSEENTKAYLRLLRSSDTSTILVAYYGIEPVAAAILHYGEEFQVERLGYMLKFYVLPEARGTRVSRALMEEATKWFDTMQCTYSYATSTAGIGQNAAFENLLGKFKYYNIGNAMKRELA